MEKKPCSSPGARMSAATRSPRRSNWQNSGASSRSSFERRERFPETSMPVNPGRSNVMGVFKMRWCFNFFAPVVALAACGVALAQAPGYKNVGRAPTEQEVQAMDIAIGTDGKELPRGSGTAKDGARIFKAKCEVCHGAELEGSPQAPALVGGKGTLTSLHPKMTVGSYWPFS